MGWLKRGDEGNNELDIPGIFILVEFSETCSHKKIAILG
jgi:hypothetical protein